MKDKKLKQSDSLEGCKFQIEEELINTIKELINDGNISNKSIIGKLNIENKKLRKKLEKSKRKALKTQKDLKTLKNKMKQLERELKRHFRGN